MGSASQLNAMQTAQDVMVKDRMIVLLAQRIPNLLTLLEGRLANVTLVSSTTQLLVYNARHAIRTAELVRARPQLAPVAMASES
jgi:hypothetical protein